jgi:putative flippase GtrA
MRIDRPGIIRASKYALAGVSTFGLDLALLFVAIDVLHVGTIPATGGAFLIAISLNHILARNFVFSETARPMQEGFSLFLFGALVGACLSMTLMYLLQYGLELHYLTARVLVAGVVGAGNYLYNLYVNFRVVGIH